VLVTTGTGFADALAAGPAAAAQDSPVLLVAPGSLPAATAQELARLRPQAITVVGGAPAVWPAVEEALRSVAPVTRVFGPDRSATSAAVARAAFPGTAPVVHLATGASFPDALAGGPAAALGGGPLLLVRKDCVPAAVQAQVDRLAPARVVVLGGASAVSDAVLAGAVCPQDGPVEPASTSGGPARTYAVESPDYASEAFGDPWDYSNAEDVHVGTPQMSDAGQIAGGLLTYRTATAFPWMDPLPVPARLDAAGAGRPARPGRHLALHARLGADERLAGRARASSSGRPATGRRPRACQGATGVAGRAGWKTYDVPLRPTDPNLTPPGRAARCSCASSRPAPPA
jgi:hypothetical protein